MATRINPFLTTGAVLATAAAVVVATPVIAPSMSLPAPTALSQAQYELTDFATFLQFLTDPTEIEYALFTGWGGAIGPINVDPQEPVNDYWLPDCDYDCAINGPSGVAYMLLDALINGDQSSDVWPTSAVNYFFEGSLGIGFQYIVQQPFAPGAPLENEAIFDAIALAWQGLYALTTFYYIGLTTVAETLSAIPLVGPLVGEGINSYLYGYFNELTGVSGPPGLSGVLAYVTDTVTQALVGLGDLLPSATAATPAASLVASAAASSLRSATPVVVETAPVVEELTISTPAVDTPKDESEAPKVDVEVVEPIEDSPAVDAVVDTEPATDVTEPATDVTEPATDVTEPGAVDPVEVAPVETAVDAVEEVSAPAETESAPAKAPKRSVRGALDRATKSVQSALSGKTADAASASSDAGSSESSE